MSDKQSLRSACAYAQSDPSLCLSLDYSMSVKVLTDHHLEFLSLKEAAEARLSLHLSKCHIVGNHMSRLIYQVVLQIYSFRILFLYFQIVLSLSQKRCSLIRNFVSCLNIL